MTTTNFLSWSSLFLVVVLQENSDLIQPGTLHRATWMAGMIYGIKIYLLINQFQLIAKELALLKCFTAFTGILYIKAWFAAPSAIAAPAGDLVLLKGLVSCLDSENAKATSKNFANRLWYLSEELAGIAILIQVLHRM